MAAACVALAQVVYLCGCSSAPVAGVTVPGEDDLPQLAPARAVNVHQLCLFRPWVGLQALCCDTCRSAEGADRSPPPREGDLSAGYAVTRQACFDPAQFRAHSGMLRQTPLRVGSGAVPRAVRVWVRLSHRMLMSLRLTQVQGCSAYWAVVIPAGTSRSRSVVWLWQAHTSSWTVPPVSF